LTFSLDFFIRQFDSSEDCYINKIFMHCYLILHIYFN
jgi:hypothetical protein